MIKTVRLIANLAINEDAGTELANKKELIDTLISILGTDKYFPNMYTNLKPFLMSIFFIYYRN